VYILWKDKSHNGSETCYRKHGFPPHFQKGNSSVANIACNDTTNLKEDLSANGDIHIAPPSFTHEQYEKILNLIQGSGINQQFTTTANQVNTTTQFGHSPSEKHKSGKINISSSFNSFSLGSWIIDSGASDHIYASLKNFYTFNEVKPISIRLPNGQFSIAKHVGTVRFSPDFSIIDVLYVPNFSLNLISVSKLSSVLNCVVSFNDLICLIQDQKSQRTIGSAEKFEWLYHLVLDDKHASCSIIQTVETQILPEDALWHFRLGHLSISRMISMNSEFPFIVVDPKAVCDVCHYARHKKLPYNISLNKATSPYELLHFDIWGPISIHSIHGHSYFLTIVDDFSRFTWVSLLKSKAEVRQHVQNFIELIENQHNARIKIIRTNNGPEFIMPQYYASKGIVHQTSCVESLQQNGRVKRKHQHVLNVGRALLFQSKLPKQFWSYAILHATYIINTIPSTLLKNKSPYLLLYNHAPNLHDLKVFGSLCYASTLQSHRTKLAPRARKCIFLGYKHGVKGVVLFDLSNREIFISRNVTHYELILPYMPSSPLSTWTYHSTPSIQHQNDVPLLSMYLSFLQLTLNLQSLESLTLYLS